MADIWCKINSLQARILLNRRPMNWNYMLAFYPEGKLKPNEEKCNHIAGNYVDKTYVKTFLWSQKDKTI